MSDLKDKVIRLAYQKPELRKHLLPLVKESSRAWGEPGSTISLKVEKDFRKFADFAIEVDADFVDEDGFALVQPASYRYNTRMTELEVYKAIKKTFEAAGFPVAKVVSDSSIQAPLDDQYPMEGSFKIRVYPK